MAKNWEKVEFQKVDGKTVLAPVKNIAKKRKTYEPYNDSYKRVKSLTSEELKEEGDKLYAKKHDEEVKLVDAYENKLIKSKTALNKAKAIVKKREKAAQEQAKKAIEEQKRDKMVNMDTAI